MIPAARTKSPDEWASSRFWYVTWTRSNFPSSLLERGSARRWPASFPVRQRLVSAASGGYLYHCIIVLHNWAFDAPLRPPLWCFIDDSNQRVLLALVHATRLKGGIMAKVSFYLQCDFYKNTKIYFYRNTGPRKYWNTCKPLWIYYGLCIGVRLGETFWNFINIVTRFDYHDYI